MKRKDTRKLNWGKIVGGGCGGFLNPPLHPCHTYSIVSVYGDTFNMSLESAAENTWIDDECKAEAMQLLRKWEKEKPAIDSKEIQDWVLHVMGYFNNCYTKDAKDRSLNSENFFVDNTINAVENQSHHLGVLHIRQYYPEFGLMPQHVKNAYWGQKVV